MKKRKRQDNMSLDSLLDTMTTVVGILIILLIVLQVGADKAVQHMVEMIKEDNATALQEIALKQVKEDKARVLKDKNELLQKATQKNKQAQQALAQITKLQKEVAAAKKPPPELAKLQQEAKTIAAQAKAAAQKLNKEKTELKSMQALLAKTEKPVASDLTKDVNLPDPKEPVKGAKPFYFLCRDAKIFAVDGENLKNRAVAGIKASKVAPNGAGEYDAKKLAAYFEKNPVANAYFRLQPKSAGDKLIRFYVSRKETAGEDVEALSKSNSAFAKTLAGIDPKKRYLLFHVFADSFDVYLSARAIAAKSKFPAGWAPTGRKDDWGLLYWGHKDIGRSKIPPPPPPKPPPPGTKPKPPKPKFPNSVID